MKRPPGEFELIARLCADLRGSRDTLLGPGDDCAILAPSRVPQLVTVDSLVENIHFKLAWMTPEVLGARALTVNLSDIAAMGGVPVACVVNLAIRPGLDHRFFTRLYRGLGAAATAAKVAIVGGNITRAADLAITITLLGRSPGSALRRDTARPGDHLFVTGTLGDAALGWRILAGELHARGSVRRFLIDRYTQPTARMRAGLRLARLSPAPAAIDVSDGLLQDLGHILERSKVGAVIDASAVPASPAYQALMRDNRELALGGGEDYELLFCLHADLAEATLTRRLGVPVRRIGRIVRRRGLSVINASGAGNSRPVIVGWDQLRPSA